MSKPKSNFYGVSFSTAANKWQAKIGHNYQQIHLGVFDTEEEAARAYDKEALELKGPHWKINFPPEPEDKSILHTRKGEAITIPPEYYDELSKMTWYLRDGYPVTNFPAIIRIHRWIMEKVTGQDIPRERVVDHIDGNPLNNSLENLRIATKKENAQNKKLLSSKNTSGYKGVYFDKGIKKYRAQITAHNVHYHLGSHACPKQAAKAYDKKARELFGEFAKVNFPHIHS